jgi:uncharacterized protein YggL (DUF469 family)
MAKRIGKVVQSWHNARELAQFTMQPLFEQWHPLQELV